MSNKMSKVTQPEKSKKRKYKPAGRPGGNPDITNYSYKPVVPGKSKIKNISLKVDEDMFEGLKKLPHWQDLIRKKLGELLQENAIATSSFASTETYPVGGVAGNAASG